jgi:hypothetical protein
MNRSLSSAKELVVQGRPVDSGGAVVGVQDRVGSMLSLVVAQGISVIIDHDEEVVTLIEGAMRLGGIITHAGQCALDLARSSTNAGRYSVNI